MLSNVTRSNKPVVPPPTATAPPPLAVSTANSVSDTDSVPPEAQQTIAPPSDSNMAEVAVSPLKRLRAIVRLPPSSSIAPPANDEVLLVIAT